MKMVINKSNPQIRITAPEIEALYDKCHRVEYYYIKDLRLGLLQDNWTLVEEEPVDLEKAADENGYLKVGDKVIVQIRKAE